MIWCTAWAHLRTFNLDYVNSDHKAFIAKLNQVVVDKLGERYPATGFDYEGNVYWHSYDQLLRKEEPTITMKVKRDLINRLAPNYNEVLEIGLNAGHSASIWLFTNPNIKVKAIDIETHAYTRLCADLLRETFPDRFEYFPGDSKTVFSELNASFMNCDIVHIDGGHDEHIFRADFENALTLPYNDFSRTILVDDADYPGINPVWTEAVTAGRCKILPIPDFFYSENHTVLVKGP